MHYLEEELYERFRTDASLMDFLQASTLDGLWYWDLENPEQEWTNDRYWEVLGYPPAEMKRTPFAWHRLVFEEDLAPVEAAVRRHLADPSVPYDQVMRFRHQQGHTVWIRCRASVLRDAAGRPLRMLGIHTDITAAKHAEAQAANSAAFYRTILQNQSAFIIRLSRSGCYTFVNAAYCRAMGFSEAQLLGQSAYRHILAEDLAHSREVTVRCWEQPQTAQSLSMRKRRADGSILVVDWEVKALHDARGEADELLCIGIDVTEKRAAQDEVVLLNNLLSGAQRVARLGGWTKDLHTQRTIWTDQVYIIHEVGPDFNPTHEACMAFYDPDTQQRIEKALAHTIRTHQPFDLVCPFTTARGNSRFVRLAGQTVVENGVATQLIGTMQDVTQAEADKEILRHERNFSQSIVENLLDGFIAVSAEGIQTQVNSAFCRMTGFERAELVGKGYPLPYDPRPYQAQWNDFQRMCAIGQGRLEMTLRCKDGTLFPALVSCASLRNADGQVTSILATVQDLSEQKQAQAKLQHTQQRLDSILHEISDVIWSVRIPDYKTLFTSPAAEKLFGYSAAEWMEDDQLWRKVIHPDDWPTIANTQREIMHSQGSKVEYRIVTREGQIKWVQNESKVVTDPVSGEARIDGITRDITQERTQKQENERLLRLSQQQNARLKNFAHIVSHNLRSHSGNFSTLIELFCAEHPELANDQIVQMLGNAAGNLKDTIKHLSDVVLMHMTSDETLARLELGKVVRRAHQNLAALAQKAHVTIRCDSAQPVWVYGVPAYLDSVVLNLLSNAIKYAAPDRARHVEVHCQVAEDHCLLTVADNGLGIDLKRYGDRLFGMYKTFHRHPDARGIGLYLTKNQVEAMGGRIEVNSQPGEGTTFRVILQKAE